MITTTIKLTEVPGQGFFNEMATEKVKSTPAEDAMRNFLCHRIMGYFAEVIKQASHGEIIESDSKQAVDAMVQERFKKHFGGQEPKL